MSVSDQTERENEPMPKRVSCIKFRYNAYVECDLSDPATVTKASAKLDKLQKDAEEAGIVKISSSSSVGSVVSASDPVAEPAVDHKK